MNIQTNILTERHTYTHRGNQNRILKKRQAKLKKRKNESFITETEVKMPIIEIM